MFLTSLLENPECVGKERTINLVPFGVSATVWYHRVEPVASGYEMGSR